MTSYKKLILVFIFVCLTIPTVHSSFSTTAQPPSTMPTIDGKWSPGEYTGPNMTFQTVTTGKPITFNYRVNATYLFFIATYVEIDSVSHNSTGCLIDSSAICLRDYFAIGFENNGDHIYMGKKASPDDVVFVGMDGNYSTDAYMQGIGNPVVRDTSIGGTNDTLGRYTYNSVTGVYTYEGAVKLHSGDTRGHDINVYYGDTITLMLAYWDDLPAVTEITSYTPFFTHHLIDPLDPAYSQITLSTSDIVLVTGLILVCVIFAGFYVWSRKHLILR